MLFKRVRGCSNDRPALSTLSSQVVAGASDAAAGMAALELTQTAMATLAEAEEAAAAATAAEEEAKAVGSSMCVAPTLDPLSHRRACRPPLLALLCAPYLTCTYLTLPYLSSREAGGGSSPSHEIILN